MDQANQLIVGIDLGTTHSLVSVVDSGFPIVLADEAGQRITPSVVHFSDNNTPDVGAGALRSQAADPENTIASIKRLIGRRYEELSAEEIAELPYRVEAADDGDIHVVAGAERYSPQQISAEILRHLHRVAESALEESVSRAVITVPAYFSHRQREATREAAELAGWTVERILNEPTAAALAYGLDQSEDGQHIAVYDLGGGTFDLSILELRDGVFEVIATSGDTRLGGDDIDSALMDRMIADLQLDANHLDSVQKSRLLAEARTAKEKLSSEETVTVELPFFDGSNSFQCDISRATLDALALPLLERTRAISRKAFLEAEHKGAGKIDHLILVGGSTRMPLVREKLEQWFGLEPNLTQHPDEAVALGAGIQAGILCGRVKQVILLDVVPLSLGIETIGGLMNVIIPRNTTIPAKAGELFTNAVANQESMAVRILQGERELARDNWLLGEIQVPFAPGPKGSARVGVQFEIDENGILTVLTRDTQTGTDQVLTIESSAVDVEDEAVENMVSESIEHAFEDMNARVLTEVRMKSQELLPAVESALQMIGDELPPEERQNIERSASRVKSLLEMENPPLEDLKAANLELDDNTQHLAAILVEKAMDQALGN